MWLNELHSYSYYELLHRYRILFDNTRIVRKFAPAPEFDIPRNVLELVYGQSLIWCVYFAVLTLDHIGER